MLSELALLKHLDPHPHVIQLYGCVTTEGKFVNSKMQHISQHIITVLTVRVQDECVATLENLQGRFDVDMTDPRRESLFTLFFFFCLIGMTIVLL